MVRESDSVTDPTHSGDQNCDFTGLFAQKRHGTKVKQEEKSVRMMSTISETVNSLILTCGYSVFSLFLFTHSSN